VEQVTTLLRAWSDGDQGALAKLAPIVYDELRRLAKSYMRRERPGHTLQTTALVNEAYIRLVDTSAWSGRIARTFLRRLSRVDAAYPG
jgi:hypothetical protein